MNIISRHKLKKENKLYWISKNIRLSQAHSKITLYKFQKDALSTYSNNKAIIGERRSGKTTMLVIDAIHRAETQKNIHILFAIPPTLSKIISNKVAEILNASNLRYRAQRSHFSSNELIYFFPNNSSILLLSPRDDSVCRNLIADYIYIDEPDFFGHNVLNALFNIALGPRCSGVTIVGTPIEHRVSWFSREIKDIFLMIIRQKA